MVFLYITIVVILPLIFVNPKKLMLLSFLPWWALKSEDREDIFENSLFTLALGFHKRIKARKRALKEAGPFLKKYKKIFGDQTLSNENCQISILKTKTKTLQIICISKVAIDDSNHKPMLTADNPHTDNEDLELFWNDICLCFSTATSYQSILNDCSKRALLVKEHQINPATNKSKVEHKQNVAENSVKVQPPTHTDSNQEPQNNGQSADENENTPPKRIMNQQRILDL